MAEDYSYGKQNIQILGVKGRESFVLFCFLIIKCPCILENLESSAFSQGRAHAHEKLELSHFTD